MRISCDVLKLAKMSQNVSSAAVVIGVLWVKLYNNQNKMANIRLQLFSNKRLMLVIFANSLNDRTWDMISVVPNCLIL